MQKNYSFCHITQANKHLWIIMLRAIPIDQVIYVMFLDIFDKIAKQGVL